MSDKMKIATWKANSKNFHLREFFSENENNQMLFR